MPATGVAITPGTFEASWVGADGTGPALTAQGGGIPRGIPCGPGAMGTCVGNPRGMKDGIVVMVGMGNVLPGALGMLVI